MWIVAEDVRDGQRMAFPQFAAAVSFDIQQWVRDLHDKLRRLRQERDAVLARVRAEMLDRLKLISAEEEADVRANDELQLERVEAQFNERIEQAEKRLKVEEQVEALIYFDGKEWPVRAVAHKTSWDDVRAWTGRTALIDTSQLPRLDD